MIALVTGGGGFLGKAIVERLVTHGDQVRSLARGAYPALEALGVDVRRGDIGDERAVDEAVQGCDVVFHIAAKAGVWGRREEYEFANIDGTRHVLNACMRYGVTRLVYASSPSVVYSSGGIEGGDESLPYPRRYSAHYPRTKAVAEQLVLEANGPRIQTVALRPHLIWGPGDNHLIPRIVERARSGQLRLVGDGKALIDAVYIDNAAEAHVLAADRLGPSSACAGKAYFITNGEPIEVGTLINRIIAAAGLPPVTRSVPPRLAYLVGGLMEAVYGLLQLPTEPRMTRFLAQQLSTPHWFNISAARRDLGYEPRVSLDEGLERLAKSFSEAAPEAA